MDKNTLSQYGWVIICIIVIAIMIGLATPFGNFVKQSVDNTIHSFDDKITTNLSDSINSEPGNNPEAEKVLEDTLIFENDIAIANNKDLGTLKTGTYIFTLDGVSKDAWVLANTEDGTQIYDEDGKQYMVGTESGITYFADGTGTLSDGNPHTIAITPSDEVLDYIFFVDADGGHIAYAYLINDMVDGAATTNVYKNDELVYAHKAYFEDIGYLRMTVYGNFSKRLSEAVVGVVESGEEFSITIVQDDFEQEIVGEPLYIESANYYLWGFTGLTGKN
jgi:hypothetical protein